MNKKLAIKEIKRLAKQNNITNIDLLGQQDKPPQKVLDKLIEKTKKLIKGTKAVYSPVDGLLLEYEVFWEVDHYPTLQVIRARISKNSSKLAKYLWRMHEDLFVDEFDEAWEDFPEFNKMQKEIDKVMAESDKLEEKYADYDWNDDVLQKAK